jgi:hypothetical protein
MPSAAATQNYRRSGEASVYDSLKTWISGFRRNDVAAQQDGPTRRALRGAPVRVLSNQLVFANLKMYPTGQSNIVTPAKAGVHALPKAWIPLAPE